LDPEQAWASWRTEKLLTPSGVRSPDHQAYSLVGIATTLYLDPTDHETKRKI
jgi:hypothetical protein